MRKKVKDSSVLRTGFLGNTNLSIRTKLIGSFLLVKIIPIIIITVIAFQQIVFLGNSLREIAVKDSSDALNAGAVENIERMTTDTAQHVANFLYDRDADLTYLSKIEPSEENYQNFILSKERSIIEKGEWALSTEKNEWVPVNRGTQIYAGGQSTNKENEDENGFHYRNPENYSYKSVAIYDEIAFVGLDGMEQFKVVAENTTKVNFPLSKEKRNVSDRLNTYIKAETYFDEVKNYPEGKIYVSDVIGAYVGSNYIGMYTPENVSKAAEERGYSITYNAAAQAYSGMENPYGQRFEGIIRFAMPVFETVGGVKTKKGYVTFALNHDHIMEFVDHITPMNERYTELPNAYEGNYAFIWDYQCRSIAHPRHHSITGYDPKTGMPEIPWLESSIYDGWKNSDKENWWEYTADYPTFFEQSRSKKPAPTLTQQGLVGLDGRYLNNAPQCTGWMDLTAEGGSGSFYILWSGLYKLTTAAAIPYYTGQYAPSESNDFSKRGFGFVAIGAGLEDFARPAKETGDKLTSTIDTNLNKSMWQMAVTVFVIISAVVLIAVLIASSLTGSIRSLVGGMDRFRSGERQFRFKTARKDEFGKLAESFDHMADSIVDSVKNSLCITDMNGKIIYMNESGLAFCKTTLKDVVNSYYSKTSVYPSHTKYDPIFSLEEGREAEIFHLEDVDRYLRGKANYLYAADGTKKGYIIETIDMTDMVLKQIKIEEQKRLLDEIFASSPDLIWYKNADGVYLTVNPRFAAITGASPDSFTGKRSEEVFPAGTMEEFIRHDIEVLSSTAPLYSEERIRFADGHEETLESVRTPIFEADGSLVGMLGFARNITQRVRIESELRETQLDLEKAVDEANRANQHKGDFLARMSHEIRTPMNAIIGITNMVLKKLNALPDKESTSDVLGYVNQIDASSRHLLGLLNDILDISKIEAGKIELVEEITDINRMLNTVVTIIKPRCDEKNITFKTVFDEIVPSIFVCDSLRLRQVLINLLGNAVKFTPECGEIEFRVTEKAREDSKVLLGFSVRDTGIGISDDALDAVFRPFEQGDKKITHQYGGTGLGLAISRKIVELFGGDIEVTSKLGEGSEFKFELWLEESDVEIPQEEELADITDKYIGKRVLLVDDVEINRMVVKAILEPTGISVDEASDGAIAVEMFQKSAEGTYDIILMDIKMPNMDGYQASRVIRSMDRKDAHRVPIIALTANAFADDINEALKHGMNAHVAKPVEPNTLMQMLIRYV